MPNSMTGFARAELESDAGRLVMELRSVNHRYLDMNMRLPEELRSFEGLIREKIQKFLSRGKVDCNVRYSAASGSHSIKVDEQRARALLEATARVESWMENARPVSAIDVLQWPGVIAEDRPDENALKSALTQVLNQALENMNNMRADEGGRLTAIIQTRLDSITEIVAATRKRREVVLQGVRTKLLNRLETLDVEADPNRLEQELAFIAQKLDVDEELDRMESHIKATSQALGKKEPVGRKLDFLMQEFNREANTLSSKSADSETTAAAVELKVLIEQMREQVQNME